MASKPTVTLGFAGDATQLEKAIDRVGDSTKRLAGDVDKASADLRSSSQRMGEGFDRVGEGADRGELRILGLKDSVDGVATVMAGPGEQGIAAYLQGWADLASGIANFAIPAIKAVSSGLITQATEMAKAAAATVVGVAQQVAQWVVMGAQATAQAARVAAAWLISIGPIAAVAAAVAGLVFVFVKHWDTIKGIVAAGATWVRDRLGDIVGLFAGLGGRIGEAMGNLAEILTAPYRAAFGAIKRLWNSTIGGFGFEFGGWDPPGPGRVPGISFRIPEMHAGGVVPGPPGTEVPILAMAGEHVSARGQGGGGTIININVSTLDARAAGPAVVSALRSYVRENGAIVGLAI